MSQNDSPTILDVRVRERMLKRGALDSKEVEKHLGGLKDLDAEVDKDGKKLHYEIIDIRQPALGDSSDD